MIWRYVRFFMSIINCFFHEYLLEKYPIRVYNDLRLRKYYV